MRTHTHCRQCGYKIVTGGRSQDIAAQEKGFCSFGCSAVWEAIMEDLKDEAEKDMEREQKTHDS